MPAKRYLIRGDVQGVGYRYFTKAVAERLGVKGFVRNLHSGEVEVHAEADKTTLELFRLELERGPRLARVNEIVEVEEAVPAPGKYSSFLIRG